MSSTARKAGLAGRGGHPLLTGLLIGLVTGVGLSAGVAVWVSRMPSPFQNRAQDAGEAAPAVGGVLTPATGPNAAGGQAAGYVAGSSLPPGSAAAAPGSANPSGGAPGAVAGAGDSPLSARLSTQIDPARIGSASDGAAVPPATAAGNGNGTMGDTRRDVNTAATSGAASRIPDGTPVFLQVGAYSAAEDAQKQVETVAQLTGARARVSSAEGERPLYRVRVGPFNRSADYAELVDALKANGIGSTVVRSAAIDVQH